MSEVAEVEEVETLEESGPVVEDLSVMETEEAEAVVEENVEEASVQPDEVTEKVEITLGDESLSSEEEETAPSWVRDLRKEYRETKKQNRELQKRLEEASVATEQKLEPLGQKPRLEDHEYDTEKHEAALDAWYERKNQHQAEKQRAEAESQRQQAEWQEKLNSYEESKGKLGVDDYQDAEEFAMETFDQTQQSLILEGTDNPALVLYALGKRPEKAKELASIKNPIKLVAAMAKLEAQLKVNKVTTKPAPEKKVTGSSQNTGGVDSTLERLEAEALKTNDYTKVFQYEKELRAKLKAQANA